MKKILLAGLLASAHFMLGATLLMAIEQPAKPLDTNKQDTLVELPQEQTPLSRASFLQTQIAPYVQLQDSNQQLQSVNDELITTQRRLAAITTGITYVFSSTNPEINHPGNYALANDINGALTIESDNVTLCLNEHRVTGDSLLGYGILVNDKKHVEIYNGIIGPDTPGTLTSGILATNATDLHIHDVNLINNQRGLYAQDSINIFVKDCRSQFFTNYGFCLTGCENSLLQSCYALTSTLSDYAIGFKSEDGYIDTFEKCQARDLVATTSALGFWLEASKNCLIKKCFVDTISADNSAYGIFLNFFPVIPPLGPVVNINSNQARGANAPSFAFSDSRSVMAVWQEYINTTTSNIYARRFDGTTFQWDTTATNISHNPDQIAQTFAHNIGADSQGNALAVWSEESDNFFTVYARYYDAETGWDSSATAISNDPTQPISNASTRIAMNDSGKAMAIWIEKNSETEKYNLYVRGYKQKGEQWDDQATNISIDQNQDVYMPAQIGIDSAGNVLVVWEEAAESYSSCYNTTTKEWGPATLIPTPPTVGEPSLAVNSAGNALLTFFDDSLSIYGQYYNAETKSWEINPTLLFTGDMSESGIGGIYPTVAINNTDNGIAIWIRINFNTATGTIFIAHFNGNTHEWTLPAEDITSTASSAGQTSVYMWPKVAIDQWGNILAAWRFTISDSVENLVTRTYNKHLNIWGPIVNSSNNPLATVGEFEGRLSYALGFSPEDLPLIIWPEQNLAKSETPLNIFTRYTPTPPPTPPQNENCLVTSNNVTNVTTDLNNAIGIEGYSYLNAFTKNIVAYSDASYGTAIANIQSGYTGSNTLFNVSLPR